MEHQSYPPENDNEPVMPGMYMWCMWILIGDPLVNAAVLSARGWQFPHKPPPPPPVRDIKEKWLPLSFPVNWILGFVCCLIGNADY